MSKPTSNHHAQMSVKKRQGKYYYHCKSDSATGRDLHKLLEKCNEVSRTADEWVIKQGGESFIESQSGLAGGVVFVIFDHEPDLRLWKREEDVDVEMSFDAEQIAAGAGLYAVNIPDDLDMLPYLNGDVEVIEDTAIALAVERMQLPLVTMPELLTILRPRPSKVTMSDGTQRVLPIHLSATPRLFEYNGWWYVEMPMLIDGEGFNQISKRTFEQRMNQALRTE